MKRYIAIWIVLAGLVLMPAAAQAGGHGWGHGHGGYGYGRGWGHGYGGHGYGHSGYGHHGHHGHYDHYYGWYGAAAAAAAVVGTAVIVDSLYDSRDCGGYWDVERVWIPAVTERVWCRSCYTEYTDLGPGCWKDVVVRPGYYEDRRVWVNQR